MQPIETTNRFELVCYNLPGPFLPSYNESTYAMIIVDHFSKWCEIVPLKREQTAILNGLLLLTLLRLSSSNGAVDMAS